MGLDAGKLNYGSRYFVLRSATYQRVAINRSMSIKKSTQLSVPNFRANVRMLLKFGMHIYTYVHVQRLRLDYKCDTRLAG